MPQSDKSTRTIKKPLSDVSLRDLKPTDKPAKISDGGGLFLLVTPAGGKLWRFSYRFGGKQKTLALGVYPDTSLKAAREARQKARTLLAEGIDPGAERKAAKLATATTFEGVAREWHAMKCRKGWSLSTAGKIMSQLETHVFPHIGAMPLVSVKASHLLAMLRKVEAGGAAYTAARLREVCGEVFRYAATDDWSENPAARLAGKVTKPPPTHRPAITSRLEFGAFLRDLRAADGYDPVTIHACRFALLTFVRAQEFRFAKWEEIDFSGKEWKVPAKRMKIGKGLSDHTVPLSRQVLELLERLRDLTGYSPYLFPRLKANGESKNAVISENTVGKMLDKMGYKGRQCVHGFRASARSILSEQGWSREAMERQLDHREGSDTVAAYARSEHLPERRKMMQAWADTVDALEAGAAVLPFAKGA